MLLGEQPGDQEDLSGKPFVGPAGQLLDRALEEAGIDRNSVYVTNTVKHFKWEPRGKRRIHQKPSSRDIAACRPWLEAELRRRSAGSARLPWLDRGAGALWLVLPGHERTRQGARVGARASRGHDGASFVASAAAG